MGFLGNSSSAPAATMPTALEYRPVAAHLWGIGFRGGNTNLKGTPSSEKAKRDWARAGNAARFLAKLKKGGGEEDQIDPDATLANASPGSRLKVRRKAVMEPEHLGIIEQVEDLLGLETGPSNADRRQVSGGSHSGGGTAQKRGGAGRRGSLLVGTPGGGGGMKVAGNSKNPFVQLAESSGKQSLDGARRWMGASGERDLSRRRMELRSAGVHTGLMFDRALTSEQIYDRRLFFFETGHAIHTKRIHARSAQRHADLEAWTPRSRQQRIVDAVYPKSKLASALKGDLVHEPPLPGWMSSPGAARKSPAAVGGAENAAGAGGTVALLGSGAENDPCRWSEVKAQLVGMQKRLAHSQEKLQLAKLRNVVGGNGPAEQGGDGPKDAGQGPTSKGVALAGLRSSLDYQRGAARRSPQSSPRLF